MTFKKCYENDLNLKVLYPRRYRFPRFARSLAPLEKPGKL